MNWLFSQPNPIGLNTIFAMNGAASTTFRAPYWPYNEKKRNEIMEILADFDATDICGGMPKKLRDDEFTVLGNYDTAYTSFPIGDKEEK